jgi:hypothetical protein
MSFNTVSLARALSAVTGAMVAYVVRDIPDAAGASRTKRWEGEAARFTTGEVIHP